MNKPALATTINDADAFFGSWMDDAVEETDLTKAAYDMLASAEHITQLVGYHLLCEYLRTRHKEVERAASRTLYSLQEEIRSQMEACGLALVTARKPTNTELNNAHDLGEWAFTFLCTTFGHGNPSPLAKHAHDAAYSVSSKANDIEYDDPRAFQERVAMLMMIDAALLDPDAVIRGLRWVREQLVTADPALEGK